MSSTTTTTTTPPSSSSSNFDDDDEETLRLLLDGTEPASSSLLKGLADRFLEDHNNETTTTFYKALCASAHTHGFEFPEAAAAAAKEDHKSSTTKSTTTTTTPPAAFESESGKQHIAAISSLLQVDKARAVSWTMGALRNLTVATAAGAESSSSSSSSTGQLQNLLGTRTLVMHTLRYSMEQSLARLGCVTECLRLEAAASADTNTVNSTADACATQVLTPIDQTFVVQKNNQHHHRGLFQRLLTLACEAYTPPTRDQLAPCRELNDESSSTVLPTATSMSSSSSERAWTAFVQQVFQAQREHWLRQQEQALEALLMLLYQRLEGGVQRDDLVLLLLAFSDACFFLTQDTQPLASSLQQQRCRHLAGLILIEAMGLWRVTGERTWALAHPLLLGLTTSSEDVAAQAEQELEGLRQLFVALAETVTTTTVVVQQQQKSTAVHAPEALGIFSFGVLWTLAYQDILESDAGHDTEAYWRTFATYGTGLVQVANEQCGALDYLFHIMEQVVVVTVGGSSGPAHLDRNSTAATLSDDDGPFDWQFTQRRRRGTLLLEGGESSSPQDTASGDTGAYSSIARELLVASIMAFDNLLSVHHPEVCDNLSVFCNLVGAVYHNSATLCETFWAEWDVYISSSSSSQYGQPQSSSPSPLCKLMDSAHSLANAAMTAFVENRVGAKEFLPAVAPFFRLLSSLCHNALIAEESIKVFPPQMIRVTLLACRNEGPLSKDDAHQKICVSVLESICTLIHIGQSDSSCQSLIRSMLEPSQLSKGLIDGPRVLYRILSGTDNENVIRPVLSASAALLRGAPQGWSMQLARVFVGPDSSAVSGLAGWLSKGTVCTPAAVQVLSGLVEDVKTVVFCDSLSERDAVDFLQGVATGILAASTALAASLSAATASLSGKVPLTSDTVGAILSSYSSYLRSVRAVIELHPSEIVRLAALEIRDVLVNALASSSGLGQAVAYYATAPVSLSLTIQLQEFMDKSLVIPEDDDHENKEQSNSRFGVWASVLKKSDRGQDIVARAKTFLSESIASIDKVDIDLDGIQVRGWTNGGSLQAPLQTATAALRLLSIWASLAEDIALSTSECTPFDNAELSNESQERLSALSPRVLLTTVAPAPIPIRGSSSLSSTWAGVGPMNLQILLRYLHVEAGQVSMPASATLDFLNAAIVHEQAVTTGQESALFRGISNSPRFAPQIFAIISTAINDAEKMEESTRDKETIALGIPALRLFATACKSTPSVATSMFDRKDKSEWLDTFTSCITNARKLLDAGEGDYSANVLCSQKSLSNIRLATGCLGVVGALWSVGRVPGFSNHASLSELVDTQSSTLKDLLHIVSKHTNAVDFEDIDEPSIEQSRGRCAVLTLVTSALSVLSQELGYIICTRDEEEMKTILASELGGDFFLLAPMARHYSTFDGFEMVLSDALLMKEKAGSVMGTLRLPHGLLDSSPSSSSKSLSKDSVHQENAFDINLAAELLSLKLPTPGLDCIEIAESISASYQTVICELRTNNAWGVFADLVSVLFQHGSGPSSEVFATLSQEILFALHTNLKPVEIAQVNISRGFLRAEAQAMTSRMSKSMLTFINRGLNAKDVGTGALKIEDMLKMLSKLTRTCFKVQDIVLSSPSPDTSLELSSISNLCALEQPLMACAISLVRAIESGTAGDLDKNAIYIDLARATSRFIRSQKSLSRKEIPGQDFLRYITTPISLLTALIAKKSNATKVIGEETYLSTFAETLKENEVVDCLMWQASSASTGATALRESGAKQKIGSALSENDEVSIVHSVLAFANSLSVTSHPSMLQLLSSSRLAQVLSGSLFVHASKLWCREGSNRGYLNTIPPTSTFGASPAVVAQAASSLSPMGGREDPVHRIWMLSMEILSSALRSTRQRKGTLDAERTKSYFIRLALDFLGSYQEELFMCIADCCGAMNGSTSKPFTLNALHEAKAILSLVSELSSRENRDEFARQAGPLYEQFVRASLSITVSLSTFLGAVGTSRELFIALTELESPGTSALSPGSNRPRNPLLANGVPHSKHEAIRYSHFARQSFACVTKSNYEDSTKIPDHFKHLSEGRVNDPPLERNCRQAVTSSFILQLEKAASECLLRAISIAWDSHPAASSFVMFSYAEATRLDPMPLVKPGMIIAIRPGGSEGVIADTNHESIRFGKVLHCDTVNRSFHINMQSGRREGGSTSNELSSAVEVVSANRLAGIEDVSKRQCVAAYRPAPDSAADLELAGSHLTLGHLILILRWCHQFSASAGASEGGQSDTVRRIAEQTAALLGAELSIHHEIGSPVNMPKADRSRLDWQIMQLFGDSIRAQEATTGQSPLSVVQQGKLQNVMSDRAWDAIQPQVQREVSRARDELEQKEKRRREKRGLTQDAQFTFGGIRRSGYKSPFRGLG